MANVGAAKMQRLPSANRGSLGDVFMELEEATRISFMPSEKKVTISLFFENQLTTFN